MNFCEACRLSKETGQSFMSDSNDREVAFVFGQYGLWAHLISRPDHRLSWAKWLASYTFLVDDWRMLPKEGVPNHE